MEAIVITPKNEHARNKLNTFLEEMKDLFVTKNLEAQEKPYILKELNKSVIKQKEAGTLKTINPKNIWESI